MQDRRVGNDAKYHLKYLRNNMDMIHCLNISATNIIQLTDLLGGIQHCVTVIGKWIFDSNIPFALPLTCDNLEHCLTNDNEKK